MWVTIRSTCRRMPAIDMFAFSTVSSPARAEASVSSATCATRWALSAICREVASSSLIVVVISLIAVACSFAPVACWLAAACSSADELWIRPIALPILFVSEATVNQPITATRTIPIRPPQRMIRFAHSALEAAALRALIEETGFLMIRVGNDDADLVHKGSCPCCWQQP